MIISQWFTVKSVIKSVYYVSKRYYLSSIIINIHFFTYSNILSTFIPFSYNTNKLVEPLRFYFVLITSSKGEINFMFQEQNDKDCLYISFFFICKL